MNIYDAARVKFATAALNWNTFDMVVVAWRGIPDFIATDDEISDVMARGNAIRIADSLPIINKAVALDGSLQTDQVIISGVPIGQPVTWLTVCERNVNPNLHQMILSVEDALGLPFDSNALDIILQPDWLTKRGWAKL